MFKRFLSLIFSFILILTSIIPTFANELGVENNNEEVSIIHELEPEITNYSDVDNKEKLPNFIPMTVTANSDGTGCKVKIGNLGVDSLDLVTVTVKATGHSTKTQSSKVIPITGKTFSFSLPMIKANTIYDVTVKVQDGGKYITKTGQAKLQYTESKLSGTWHRGTFSSRGASLDYHFNKHKGEVSGTSNMVGYINKAINYRSEISKSTANITITTGTGSIPSKKYKHRIDGRFIILTNSGREILSFGR